MLPGIRSLAVAMHLKIHWVYTRYLSSCCFVGCFYLPQSHRYLCSWGCVHLPPRCNLKSIGYICFAQSRQNTSLIEGGY
ncbi:hypothetical protein [Photorhabdus australis]|uniref:hypothetical protein n=1 Tax=Photorhabdus australis TaxID=286156 RepID=UPI0030DA0426